MTFYLMFQFCYMVLGILYATWRVVLAVVVMLLFSVSALDRSLLMMFKVRGPCTDSASTITSIACHSHCHWRPVALPLW